jgi:rod shape-determining protein MreC
MFPPSDRTFSRRDTVLFLACVALSLTAIFSPERITTGVAGALRATALRPLVWLQERAEEGRTSRARLRALMAERDSAAYAAQNLPSLVAENERLRELLGLSHRLKARYVAAEVLHQAQVTDARTLLLNVGSDEGVATFDPIVGPDGLIGVVSSVGRTTSVAMTWAHPEFRVSAFTPTGNAFGIVAAAPSATGNDAYLEFRGVPYRDSIPPGTPVLSSGLGGVYPKGIPIGTVVGIAREQTGWERVYRVRPAANPGATAHVLVLVGERTNSVAEAFPSEGGAPRPDSARGAAPAAIEPAKPPAARPAGEAKPAVLPRAETTAPRPAAAQPRPEPRGAPADSAAGARPATADSTRRRPRTGVQDSAARAPARAAAADTTR